MKRLFLFFMTFLFSFLTFSQEKLKIDSLQNEIKVLTENIDSLKKEIQDEVLANGYTIIAKSPYSYSRPKIKLTDSEFGTVIDTIIIGENFRIIDKTTSFFKVSYKGKIGYIYSSDIDITDYPILNYLESSSLRNFTKNNSSSNYSTNTNKGGAVSVKGYYRKDGTYVRPHTRRSSGSRRR